MRLATKDRNEVEDDEADRLVRPAPKQKPPRRDTRREQTKAPDSDVDRDPDTKSEDMSLNYKSVGGSIVDRVVFRYAAEEKVRVRHKETGRVVNVLPSTLKQEPGKYEKVDDADESADTGPSKPTNESTGIPSKVPGSPPSEPEQGSQGESPSNEKAPPSNEKEPSSQGKDPSQDGGEEEPSPASGDSESESEGKSKQPAPEPSVSEKLGITSPKRRKVSREETLSAALLLADNLPPKMAAKLIAQNLHPDDVREVVNTYKGASTKEVRDLPNFMKQVSGFYQMDPDKVDPPKTWENSAGQKTDFDKLQPNEQAEAYRKHQMQTLALSAAAERIVTDKLSFPVRGKPSIPENVASTIAQSLFTTDEQAQESAGKLYQSLLKSDTVAPISPKVGRKLLDAVNWNPGAKETALAFLTAADYRQAKTQFLENEKITEHHTPAEIAVGLMDADTFFQDRAASYGQEHHQGQARFQRKVFSQLRKLDTAKYAQVRKVLDHIERRRYEEAKIAHTKAMRVWAHTPVEARGEEPVAPVEPLGAFNAKSDDELKKEGRGLWDTMFNRSKTAASVGRKYLISSYLTGISMPGAIRKQGLYHGVDPADHYPPPYTTGSPTYGAWVTEADYAKVLAAAKEWLKNPVLAGMDPDQQCRHALDLAAPKMDIQHYNVLLAKLQGKPVPGLDQSGGQTKMALSERFQLEKQIYAKFPPDSRQKAGSRLTVMVAGAAAKALRLADYATVELASLGKDELDKLAAAVKVKTASSSYVPETCMSPAQELRQLAVKFASANPEMGYALLDIAQRVDTPSKTARVSKDVIAANDPTFDAIVAQVPAADTRYANLKSTIIKVAQTTTPEGRAAFKPILQALKDLG